MKEIRRVEDIVDAEGWIIQGGYTAWDCDKCKREVRRYRGSSSASCECGAQYSINGQRYRDNWRDNPSNYDSEIGDMEGYEMEMAGDN